MTDVDFISYEDFGRNFFKIAVTEERILSAIGSLTGQPIEVGPLGVGPGRVVKVMAKGSIGAAGIAPHGDGEVAFRVLLPVHLAFEVNLQVDTHRFEADLEVPLVLTARAADPLTIVIDAQAPHARDISVVLKADGLRASVLSKAAGVEGELKRFVAKYVRRELSKPVLVKARTIDVRASIDGAFGGLFAGRSSDKSATFTEDLAGALEQEIEDNPRLIEGLED